MGCVRVLVVDDQEPYLEAMAAVVEETAGFDVGRATTGETALTAAAELGPDLVLMDVNLPGIDGIEASRRLTSAATKVPVVILLSTYDEDEFDLAGSGATAYVAKAALSPDRLSVVWSTAAGERDGRA
jgi:CheY-like chemotaxis protein